MHISVVIPNFNGENILNENLGRVFTAAKNKKNEISEVIVVDDASTDTSVDLIKKNFPEVKLIKHSKNRGFSSSANIGVRSSKGDLILLLNTDVLVSENFLENVLPHFFDKKVFAVSLHEKGYGYAKATFNNGFIELKMGKQENETKQSFYVSGGSGVFRKRIWQELGGMDEKLFSPFYWEDIDLGFRALKRGYLNLWEPKSKVIHNHASTISKLSKKKVGLLRERNELFMIWKNIHSVSMLKKHFNMAFKRALKHPGYFLVILMALSKIATVMKSRRKEIKESKVSDEAIFARFS